MNLDKVRQMADHYEQLTDDETRRVTEQVQAALDRIEAEPKSMSWKLRAKVGDRKKWYRDVGELSARRRTLDAAFLRRSGEGEQPHGSSTRATSTAPSPRTASS